MPFYLHIPYWKVHIGEKFRYQNKAHIKLRNPRFKGRKGRYIPPGQKELVSVKVKIIND
jgi:hypothetical protein